MPRQRLLHGGDIHELPDDFPERLKQFQQQSGLSWSEIARRLGTYRNTVWRWKEGLSRPNYWYWRALLELAEDLGLAHILTG